MAVLAKGTRARGVHQFLYEQKHGVRAPDGRNRRYITNTCGNKWCVNVDHLDVRTGGECRVEGCASESTSARYCKFHYSAMHRYGTANARIPRRGIPLAERMAFYTGGPDENGCHPWTGGTNGQGYPVVSAGKSGTMRQAHRVAFELAGNVLGHQPVHHKCGNRLCVNPAHLQTVTPLENTAEMLERRSFNERIAALESALAEFNPGHPLLT